MMNAICGVCGHQIDIDLLIRFQSKARPMFLHILTGVECPNCHAQVLTGQFPPLTENMIPTGENFVDNNEQLKSQSQQKNNIESKKDNNNEEDDKHEN